MTLGHKEARDTATLLDWLHGERGFARFLLWGRSMGAVTALHLSHLLATKALPEPPWTLQGLILDSAYSRLPAVVEAVARSAVPALVAPLLPSLLKAFRHAIRDKAGFDIRCDSDLDLASFPA